MFICCKNIIVLNLCWKHKFCSYSIFYWLRALFVKVNEFVFLFIHIRGPRWQDRYPLHSFAAKGDQAEVDIRLKQNYDHSLVDSVGCAPIHYAAR